MNLVSKIPASEGARLNFLPRHFGGIAGALVEATVFSQLQQLSTQYRGGMWKFFDLSNGGCFMAPVIDGPMHLSNATNDSSETVSSEAAGIVACLYAFSRLSFRPGMDKVKEHFHLLREYALDHPERSAILALID